MIVVTFKWVEPGYHSKYSGNDVEKLFNQVSRRYSGGFRFICVTDDSSDVPQGVEAIPLWNDFSTVYPPRNVKLSCYRRLKMFQPGIEKMFNAKEGDKWVWLDLDLLIVGDITGIWDNPAPLVLWRDPLVESGLGVQPYHGAMVRGTFGAEPGLYQSFDPEVHPKMAAKKGFIACDQAWMALCLGNHWSPTLGRSDGLLSMPIDFEDPVDPNRWKGKFPKFKELPDFAKVISFHGPKKPTDPKLRERYPWIAQLENG